MQAVMQALVPFPFFVSSLESKAITHYSLGHGCSALVHTFPTEMLPVKSIAFPRVDTHQIIKGVAPSAPASVTCSLLGVYLWSIKAQT
jgi:hypothetical protein